ncbi:hypothetical protein TMFC_70064 [Tenacibaculum maritimum]|uniref:hypothetical protein n=1 Tax=Tenacibaculum maritimum TaxID=107401 RepID=UPI0012E6539F|nr:hypothetical protein [Tenacibaculum maritimum]CAA0253148.1 hypothetical protein TMFC_70064 [Tenacibaculum maritimum]
MKSTAEYPFLFFDDYFENQIQKDLKEFYTNITEELYFNNIEEIDKVRHIIKVPNIHHKEEIQADYITFSFEGSIKTKLNREINITKNFIESEFQKRFADKKEVTAYADFLRTKLKQVLNKSSLEFNFLIEYFKQISNLINHFSANNKIELNSGNTNNQTHVNSSFSVKSNVKKSIFSDLYMIADEYGVIDYEKINEDNFIKTLTDNSDDSSFIQFYCNNSMMIQFLLDIKPLFNNFKAKDIQDSKKLITKQGKPITVQIYDTAKQRLKLNSEISMMSDRIKNLLKKV